MPTQNFWFADFISVKIIFYVVDRFFSISRARALSSAYKERKFLKQPTCVHVQHEKISSTFLFDYLWLYFMIIDFRIKIMALMWYLLFNGELLCYKGCCMYVQSSDHKFHARRMRNCFYMSRIWKQFLLCLWCCLISFRAGKTIDKTIMLCNISLIHWFFLHSSEAAEICCSNWN